MELIKKTLLLLTIILLSGVFISPVNAATEQTPSVPEFSVSFNGDTLYITIKNQLFSNDNIPVYYNMRIKHHSESNWLEFYAGSQNNNTTYTILSFKRDETEDSIIIRQSWQYRLSTDRTLDIQVMRSTYRGVGREIAPPNSYIYAGSNSSWSSTKSITLPALPTPTSTPYHAQPTSTITITPQPEIENTGTPSTDNINTGLGLDWVQLVTWALLSVIIVLLLVVIFYQRKRRFSQ